MAVKYWDEMRRHYYSTPSSYMELIRLYSKLLRENKTEFMNNKLVIICFINTNNYLKYIHVHTFNSFNCGFSESRVVICAEDSI